MINNVICDKCGSGNVLEYRKPQKPKKQPIYKMSEVAAGKVEQPYGIVQAVMTYSQMILECQNCGYKLEYTKNDQLGGVVTSVSIVPTGSGMAKPRGKQPLQVNPKSHNTL